MLLGLGRDEVEGIVAERGEVEIGCDFCGTQYRFELGPTSQASRANKASRPRPAATQRRGRGPRRMAMDGSSGGSGEGAVCDITSVGADSGSKVSSSGAAALLQAAGSGGASVGAPSLGGSCVSGAGVGAGVGAAVEAVTGAAGAAPSDSSATKP
jgi:hypothetical protein